MKRRASDRLVYALASGIVGAGLVHAFFAIWGEAPERGLGVILAGSAAAGVITGALGWFFGEDVLEWLSEVSRWT